MDKVRSNRIAELIERVADSREELDGQDAAVEYVFYPRGRQKPVTRYVNADDQRAEFIKLLQVRHRAAATATATFPDLPRLPLPRLPPHCQLQSVVGGCEGEESGSFAEFGSVDVYFTGNTKTVERLKELSALVGQSIPAEFAGLDQYVPEKSTARKRAQCLAWLARLWFYHSDDVQTVTVEQDAVGTFYVGKIPDVFVQLERLLMLIVEESSAGGNQRARGLSRNEYNDLAMQIASLDTSFADNPNVRVWAKKLQCGEGTVGKLPFYIQCANKNGTLRRGQPPKPKVFSLEAVADEGERDEELERLIGEQRRDAEPSPLEADAPGRRKVRAVKSL